MATFATDDGAGVQPDRFWKNRLTRYYQRYNPSKIETLDAVLVKYKGNEHKLFAAIVKKYGPEPGVLDELDGENAEEDDDDEEDDEGDDENEKVAAGQNVDPTAWPQQIVLCPVDGLPAEYCEYGKKFKKCIPWLLENYPDLYVHKFEQTISSYCDGGGEGETGGTDAPTSAAGQADAPIDPNDPRAAKKAAKRQRKAEAEARKAKQKPKDTGPRVLITMKRRNKRKFTVNINGLEKFGGVKLKDAAKKFSKKFACSSTVTKNDMGGKEVVMQGDFSQDLGKIISEMFPSISIDNIFFAEKKGSGVIPAASIKVGQKIA
jgi:density-regulated protein DRP1